MKGFAFLRHPRYSCRGYKCQFLVSFKSCCDGNLLQSINLDVLTIIKSQYCTPAERECRRYRMNTLGCHNVLNGVSQSITLPLPSKYKDVDWQALVTLEMHDWQLWYQFDVFCESGRIKLIVLRSFLKCQISCMDVLRAQ